MEGPYEAAVPYEAPHDDATGRQAPMQEQPTLRQLEQQQQKLQARPEPTPEQLAKEHAAALRWVMAYEPDRLW
jgi:hypothetical protein